MELLFLVYLVDIVINLNQMAEVILAILAGWLVLGSFGLLLCSEGESDIFKPAFTKYVLWGKTALAAAIISLVIPSEKTIKYMGAAYLIQTTYQSGFVQEAGGLAGKAVINQLRKWSADNPDIDSLLESVGETKGKLETVIPATEE